MCLMKMMMKLWQIIVKLQSSARLRHIPPGDKWWWLRESWKSHHANLSFCWAWLSPPGWRRFFFKAIPVFCQATPCIPGMWLMAWVSAHLSQQVLRYSAHIWLQLCNLDHGHSQGHSTRPGAILLLGRMRNALVIPHENHAFQCSCLNSYFIWMKEFCFKIITIPCVNL